MKPGDCETCDGTGRVQLGGGRFVASCESCMGTGKRKGKRETCRACQGQGYNGGSCTECFGLGYHDK